MSTLKPNQIKEEMYVSVEKWTSHQDNSFTTDIMRVIAVDLPLFCVIHEHHGKMILSTDKLILNEVAVGFCKKVAEAKKKNPVFDTLFNNKCCCCRN